MPPSRSDLSPSCLQNQSPRLIGLHARAIRKRFRKGLHWSKGQNVCPYGFKVLLMFAGAFLLVRERGRSWGHLRSDYALSDDAGMNNQRWRVNRAALHLSFGG